jgi:hypothetical protein
VLIGRQNRIGRQIFFGLIFKLKMVQKYWKMNSQKCVLELSKSFLNKMRAFFRFTEKRKTEKVFRLLLIVGLKIQRCIALFKKFSKKRKTQKTQKILFTSMYEKVYSKKHSSKFSFQVLLGHGVLTWTAIFSPVAQLVALSTFKSLGLLLLARSVESLTWRLRRRGCRVPRETTSSCSSSPTPGLVAIAAAAAAAAASIIGVRPLGLLQRICLSLLQALESGRGKFVYGPLPILV